MGNGRDGLGGVRGGRGGGGGWIRSVCSVVEPFGSVALLASGALTGEPRLGLSYLLLSYGFATEGN